ncbi:MAG: RrF2 family transcriptional regulator [Acidobacteriota bacterium]
MKLTRAAEYAIRCVLFLAKRQPGPLASRREVSAAMDIPMAFLGKIVQGLAKAGVLVVRQGARGGYELALPPCDISLLMVVEAIDGEILVNECLSRPQECGRSRFCAVHRVWDKARTQFRETLRTANFADLATSDDCPGSNMHAEPNVPVARLP